VTKSQSCAASYSSLGESQINAFNFLEKIFSIVLEQKQIFFLFYPPFKSVIASSAVK
jgi:hypothetical protein